ncbi:hypothetical protein, partial [Humibacillus xanthopallidus]
MTMKPTWGEARSRRTTEANRSRALERTTLVVTEHNHIRPVSWTVRLLLSVLMGLGSILAFSIPEASATPWNNTIVKQSQRPSDPTSWLLVQG